MEKQDTLEECANMVPIFLSASNVAKAMLHSSSLGFLERQLCMIRDGVGYMTVLQKDELLTSLALCANDFITNVDNDLKQFTQGEQLCKKTLVFDKDIVTDIFKRHFIIVEQWCVDFYLKHSLVRNYIVAKMTLMLDDMNQLFSEYSSCIKSFQALDRHATCVKVQKLYSFSSLLDQDCPVPLIASDSISKPDANPWTLQSQSAMFEEMWKLYTPSIVKSSLYGDPIMLFYYQPQTCSKKTRHPELITLVSLGCSLSIVQEKLSIGWDPNVQNEDGISPALKAAERNDLAMLKILIDAGAKVDVSDVNGFTPLKLAQMNENEEMIQLIKDKNPTGLELPLDQEHAAKRKHTDDYSPRVTFEALEPHNDDSSNKRLHTYLLSSLVAKQ
jgi:hypothetical protein